MKLARTLLGHSHERVEIDLSPAQRLVHVVHLLPNQPNPGPRRSMLDDFHGESCRSPVLARIYIRNEGRISGAQLLRNAGAYH